MNRRKLVTAGVLLGIFLAAVDGTVVSIAMPTVVASLGGLSLYSWVFTAYMLCTAATMPLFGRLADMYGQKRLFIIGATIFVIGSVLSGLSQSMLQLVLFRALQGAGAGAMLAIPYAILGKVYPPEMRGTAIGWGSAMWGVASVVGPEIGYALIKSVGWRAVFFLNVPVGVLAVGLIWYAFEEDVESVEESLDVAGVVTAAIGIAGVLLGVHEYTSNHTLAITAIVVGVLGFIGFYLAEHRTSDPVIPLDLYHDGIFMSANVIAFLSSFVIFTAFTYIPLLIQATQGGASSATLALLPLALGWSGTSTVMGRYVSRFGEQRIIRAGLFVMTVSFAAGYFWTNTTSLSLIIVNSFFMGVGIGALTPPLMTSVQNHLGQERMGVATSSYQLFRNTGSAMGIAILGAVLTSTVNTKLQSVSGVSSLTGVQQALNSGSMVPSGVSGALIHGLSIVFGIGAVLLFITLVGATRSIPSHDESHSTTASAESSD